MTGLPPDGAIVDTDRGPFRAIIVHPGIEPGIAVLRGWYLDRELLQEEQITVALDDISVLELG